MKKNLINFIAIILLIGIFKPAVAQYSQLEFIRSQTLRLGFHAKLWKFDNGSRFFEAALPSTYSFPVGKRLALDVVAAPFGVAFEPSAGKPLHFTSISDTYIRGSFILGNNRALLTVGVGIPSGNTGLTNDEAALSGIAANRPLNNPVTNFGTGLNMNFGLAVAHEIGSWIFGLGVGYSQRGEYNINAQGAKIDPGDEFNVTVGVDREFGSAKFIADLIYTHYLEDKSGLLDPYQAGDKLLFTGRFILALGFLNPVIISAGNRIRQDNTSTNAVLLENGNEFEFRTTAIAPLGNSFGLKFIYLNQIYGDTSLGGEGANIQGFGGGIVLKASRHFTFDPTFIYSTGRIDTGPDTETDVTGYEINGGFTFRF